MKIIAAIESDIDEILELYNDNRFGPADWDEDYPGLQTIEFDLKRNALFVCKNESGEIIATVSLDEDEEVDGLSIWNPQLFPSGEVSRICVKKEYRGQGIAKKLMLFACDEWKQKGMKGVHILVRKNHVVALSAYEKVGFVKVGEGTYHEKEFICMERSLD